MNNKKTLLNKRVLLILLLLSGTYYPVYSQETNQKKHIPTNINSTLENLTQKIIIRHTPKASFIPEIKTTSFSLNGIWLFNPSPEKDFEKNKVTENSHGWKKMDVPSEWYMQSYIVEKDNWAGYYRMIDIPEDWMKSRVIIRFGAVNSECRLYINGTQAGTHKGAMNQFEFEITPLLQPGKNQLAMYVKSESIANHVGKISHYAQHQVGGIIRGVTLMAVPQTHISELYCNAQLSPELNKGILDVQLSLNYPSKKQKKDREIKITVRKRGIEGLVCETEIVGSKQIKLTGKTNNYQLEIPIEHPELWHAESPYLYTVEWSLYENKEITESGNLLIGFRKIEIKGNVLMVNNQPVKLRGIGLHDITPYEGRAIKDTAMIRKDIELFRNANCNYIRTAHYPKDEYFMELCDRYGIFVEDEAPVCWIWEQNNNTETIEQLLYGIKSLIIRDRNHPSVIVWSIANESKWSLAFMMCHKLAKQMTPHIPIKFSHSEYFGIIEPLEVGSRHYPGWEGLMKYANYFRPIFFDEALHLNTYNTSENSTDPGLRDLWGDYIKYFTDEMKSGPAIAGFGIWSGIDEMFYPLKQKPVGYGPWGVIDGFRREKPEFWHMKMAFSPVKVLNDNFQIIKDKTLVILENRYNTLNLNTLNIAWRDSIKSGIVTVDGAPGKQTLLELPFKVTGNKLELTFYDKRGFMVSKWIVPEKSPQYIMPDIEMKEKITSSKYEDQLSVAVKQINFRFSTKSGMLECVSKNGKNIIEDGVKMYLVPLSPSSEIIDFIPQESTEKKSAFLSAPLERWVCDTLFTNLTDSSARITCHGTYDTIPASFVYTINGDGHLKVDYIINLKKVDVSKIRQIGIGFDLPKTFDNLSWKRDALWSFYPENHIGRPSGTAKAFYPETLKNYLVFRKTPTHPYSRDGNKYGSNDFRSTKHNIFEAMLQNKNGENIKVESNGKQHLRSWVTEKGISFLVANYSNGGNEHYLSYNSNRTRISPEEFNLDGGDFAGWLQVYLGD